ncbi:hypothetical protein FACS1894186_2380 [Alphaproteobacteria bacterium]|nr:hypothetical protein FACS1894186_2380 [Alphaproteobacteria bacterium]
MPHASAFQYPNQHFARKLLIVAGHGSGKTTVLTNRLARLVNESADPQDGEIGLGDLMTLTVRLLSGSAPWTF